MTGELRAGTVVEIRVGKCVFLGVVVSSSHNSVGIEMDGRLKTGTPVFICDPAADCAVQGKVLDCILVEAGGFRLLIAGTSTPAEDGEGVFVWPSNALHHARM